MHVCIPTRAAGAQYSCVLSTFTRIKQIFGGSSKSGVLWGLNHLVALAAVRAGWPLRTGVIKTAHTWSSYIPGDILQNYTIFRCTKKIRQVTRTPLTFVKLVLTTGFRVKARRAESKKGRGCRKGEICLWRCARSLWHLLQPAGFRNVGVPECRGSCCGRGLASGLGGWKSRGDWTVCRLQSEDDTSWEGPANSSPGLPNRHKGCGSGPASH